MNADPLPDNPSEKRAILPRSARWIFLLLRMFWLTALILLIVVLYGWHAGWSTPRQWSDGFCIAAFAQVIIAAARLGTQGEAVDAATLRYVPNSNIAETRGVLFSYTRRKIKFGVAVFIGAVLTMLISAAFLWI